MAARRKDDRGRVLRDGEVQRKDGMYMFRYVDSLGVRRSVYSWRLSAADRIPPGKRATEPLRDMEAQIAAELQQGLDLRSGFTLNEAFYDYLEMRRELRISTRDLYLRAWNGYVKDDIGRMEIGRICFSDVKKFFLRAVTERGAGPGVVRAIYTAMHPVFDVAVRDGRARANPSDGVLSEITRAFGWEQVKRHALTRAQQARLVGFLSGSEEFSRWRPLITVLLGTGMRIGEALALRWEDLDFEKKLIFVRHSLLYRRAGGRMEFKITPPKTRSGIRVIPMMGGVKSALENLPRGANRARVDGMSGFIFASPEGGMLSYPAVNRVLRRIIKSANSEGGGHEILPDFTAHVLRHTFCVRMCERGVNVKVVQEIMGHSGIAMTMDVYNEATLDSKVEAFEGLDGEIEI